MNTATKSGGVEFNCLGGSVELRHGYLIDEQTKQPKKMYFSRADVDKLKLPETFLAKKTDGSEVGIISLDMNKRRKIIIPYYEEQLIEMLKNHELVSEQMSGQKLTNKVGWFDPDKHKLDRQAKVQTQQLALLLAAGLKADEVRDLSICLGIMEVEKISDPDLADIINNKPKRIMDHLEYKSEGGIPKGKLLESTKIEAILRRAINKRVVTEKSGALFFAGEQIGIDFKNTMKNLQNKTKGDESSFAHIIPLIKEKLSE